MTDERPRLRLIRGGHPQISVGSVRIVAAPLETPPFAVEAVAREEDTFLVLSAESTIHATGEPFLKTLTEAHETEPEPPGTVVVRNGRPLRMLAVVHDLACDPTWKEEWVAAALEAILAEAKSRELESIAIPLLGTRHGTLTPERFVALLGAALREASLGDLERVWLIVPAANAAVLLDILQNG